MFQFIKITPIDLRWGVIEGNTRKAIQRICLNCIDSCREDLDVVPWFVGLRTDRNGWLLGDEDGNADYEKSSEFKHPELMNWIDELQNTKLALSITSLECIHAVSEPKQRSIAPRCFFYSRFEQYLVLIYSFRLVLSV